MEMKIVRTLSMLFCLSAGAAYADYPMMNGTPPTNQASMPQPGSQAQPTPTVYTCAPAYLLWNAYMGVQAQLQEVQFKLGRLLKLEQELAAVEQEITAATRNMGFLNCAAMTPGDHDRNACEMQANMLRSYIANLEAKRSGLEEQISHIPDASVLQDEIERYQDQLIALTLQIEGALRVCGGH